MTGSTATQVRLAPVLDLNAAEPLFSEINALRGRPVNLDASNVERLGALCLQVLMASCSAWRADGQPFEISARSQAFDETWALFAAPPLRPEPPGS